MYNYMAFILLVCALVCGSFSVQPCKNTATRPTLSLRKQGTEMKVLPCTDKGCLQHIPGRHGRTVDLPLGQECFIWLHVRVAAIMYVTEDYSVYPLSCVPILHDIM